MPIGLSGHSVGVGRDGVVHSLHLDGSALATIRVPRRAPTGLRGAWLAFTPALIHPACPLRGDGSFSRPTPRNPKGT